MPLIPIEVPDYTDRDFASLLRRMQVMAQTAFASWTDFDRAGTRNVLLELFAFIGDRLAYYQDSQSREAFLALALLRANVVTHARALGYIPAGPVPARVDLVLTVIPTGSEIVIPAEATARTRSVLSPIFFRSTAPVVLEPDQTEVTITAENSEQAVETFIANGSPSVVLALARRPYIDDSVIVSAANGVYEERDNLFSSGALDKHFYVVVGNDDRASLVFGDGITGQPPAGTTTVIYRYGGGAGGTVDQNSVTVFDTRVLDALGNPVTITVTNPNASSPGEDRETIESIRRLAPLSLAAQQRSVSNEDFETHAQMVGGVGRVLSLTWNEADFVPANTVDLYVLPAGGGVATQGLLDDVRDHIMTRYPPLCTVRMRVHAAPLRLVDIRVAIEIASGQVAADVAGAAAAALSTYFDPDPDVVDPGDPAIDFGYRLRGTASQEAIVPWSDIHKVVAAVQGVRLIADDDDGLLLNDRRADVQIEASEFPVLGDVLIVDALTGTTLLETSGTELQEEA
jgi:hypothetical protein